MLLLLSGCGQVAQPSSPVYSARLLASVRSEPGKLLIPPGSELSKGSECKSHHSAYVWFEILKDGQPQVLSLNEGIQVVFKLPDGTRADLFAVPSRTTQQLVALPTGFKSRASFADLEIYYSTTDKPIATFRIESLSAPRFAIKPDEPRLAKPRWRVYRAENPSGLSVEVIQPARDTISVIQLIRATYLDLSMQEPKPIVVLPDPENFRARILRDVLDASEVELEETEYGFETETRKLVVSNLEIEKVFDTPVLNLRSDVHFKMNSGLEVIFPKQRVAPFREGSGPRFVSQLQIKVIEPTGLVRLAYDNRLNAKMRIDRVTPDLGAYGVRELKIINQGSGLGTTGTLHFSETGTVKPGKLPPVTFEVSVEVPRRIGVHKGIVSIETN